MVEMIPKYLKSKLSRCFKKFFNIVNKGQIVRGIFLSWFTFLISVLNSIYKILLIITPTRIL